LDGQRYLELLLTAAQFNPFFQRMSSTIKPGKSVALEQSRYISSPSAIRDWQHMTSSLENECAALAWLAGCASTMAIVVPGARNWARVASLEMQLRATQLLQETIEANTQTLNESVSITLPVLYGLFRTECINQNVKAAAFHAKILRCLFEQGHFTLQILIQSLSHDIDLAAKTTKRTFFDVDSWCVSALSPTLISIESNLPLFRREPPEFHPSIILPRLRPLWAARHFFAVVADKTPFPAQRWGERSTGDLAFIYMTIRTFLENGQLINLYMDLIEDREMMSSEPFERYLHAALTVALIYMGRRNAHECYIGSVDVRDASQNLMRELRRALILSWSHIAPEYELSQVYQEAFLWILYVGAVNEKRMDINGHPHPAWFCGRLCEQASACGVQSWCQMRTIAEQFLYTPLIGPDGIIWFDSLLQAYKVAQESDLSTSVTLNITDRARGGITGDCD
jgi:hypothetical protein